MAESAVPIRRTKPQLQLFIPWACRRPPACAIGTKIVIRCHRIRHSGEGRNPEGKGVHQPHPNTSNDQVSFSYLRVPAPAGMRDCYESMSRTPIRDRPPRQPLIRHSRHPFVNPTSHSSFRRRPESRGEGWHQPHPNTSNDQASISYLGAPAPAGMRDCYESMSRIPIRDRPLRQPLIRHSRHPFANPTPQSSFRRRPESRGEGWRQPHPNTSNDQVSFSYLGVPAPAGMRDCYESMSRTPIRDRPPRQPLIRHSRHPFVNPTSHSSFRRRPESRGEGWHQPHPNTSNDQASISYLGAPAPAGMGDWYENSYPLPPVSSFQRKLESRRGGVGDRDEDVDDGAAPVGRNAAACLLGPWLGTSPSATFLPLHCQMLIHGSGKIGWPA